MVVVHRAEYLTPHAARDRVCLKAQSKLVKGTVDFFVLEEDATLSRVDEPAYPKL